MTTDPDIFQKERTVLAQDRTSYAKERTRLAAERTFSAWIRTGLAGVGGGLALVRFVPFKDPTKIWVAHVSGSILLLWGLLVIIYALRSYHLNIKKLEVEKDPTSRIGITAIALALILFCVLIFILAEE